MFLWHVNVRFWFEHSHESNCHKQNQLPHKNNFWKPKANVTKTIVANKKNYYKQTRSIVAHKINCYKQQQLSQTESVFKQINCHKQEKVAHKRNNHKQEQLLQTYGIIYKSIIYKSIIYKSIIYNK